MLDNGTEMVNVVVEETWTKTRRTTFAVPAEKAKGLKLVRERERVRVVEKEVE